MNGNVSRCFTFVLTPKAHLKFYHFDVKHIVVTNFCGFAYMDRFLMRGFTAVLIVSLITAFALLDIEHSVPIFLNLSFDFIQSELFSLNSANIFSFAWRNKRSINKFLYAPAWKVRFIKDKDQNVFSLTSQGGVIW
jgi:hypothetical protein